MRQSRENIALPLVGAHQTQNAALALGLVDLFCAARRWPVPSAPTVRSAWRGLRLPGRLEFVDQAPWTVLDGAHNPAAAWALADALRERFPPSRPWILIFNTPADKPAAALWTILGDRVREAVFVDVDSPRFPSAETRLREWRAQFPDRPAVAFARTADALEHARRRAGENGVVVATGSFRLVGALHRVLASRTSGA